MGSATRLLVGMLALISLFPRARADTSSPLTLSPDTSSLLLSRREEPRATIGSTDNPTDQDSSVLDPALTITDTSSNDSGTGSNEDAPPPPSPRDAAPSSNIDRTTNDSYVHATSTTPSAPPSKSSTAPADAMSNKDGGLRSHRATSVATVVPIGIGSLACLGAVILFVKYKRLRTDATFNERSGRRSSEYKGASFEPTHSSARAAHVGSIDLNASAHTGGPTTSSAGSMSPFCTTRCTGRVSSPIPSTSATNMEFQDTSSRQDGSELKPTTFDDAPL
ncbi:hypothetical protein PsorP6_016158 [Peronosclerospora sorghi]|uniref:Uncharacterized protein n=1 Tax=Peronosclerospora sorghi TaxID=230839 RepID=A0ACC0VQS4_9STRA|nr:hypothetical protein PsorP6_016158 [Peronosclerospora sorghi]